MLRYRDTDSTYMLNCWSPSRSLKTRPDPPKKSPPLVTPMFTGGRPSRNIRSNAPFRRLFSGSIVCGFGTWNTSVSGPGVPKSSDAAATMGSSNSIVCSSQSDR